VSDCGCGDACTPGKGAKVQSAPCATCGRVTVALYGGLCLECAAAAERAARPAETEPPMVPVTGCGGDPCEPFAEEMQRCDWYAAEVTRLRAVVTRLRAGLEVYAADDSWAGLNGDRLSHRWTLVAPGWAAARRALAETAEIEGEERA